MSPDNNGMEMMATEMIEKRKTKQRRRSALNEEPRVWNLSLPTATTLPVHPVCPSIHPNSPTATNGNLPSSFRSQRLPTNLKPPRQDPSTTHQTNYPIRYHRSVSNTHNHYRTLPRTIRRRWPRTPGPVDTTIRRRRRARRPDASTSFTESKRCLRPGTPPTRHHPRTWRIPSTIWHPTHCHRSCSQLCHGNRLPWYTAHRDYLIRIVERLRYGSSVGIVERG